MTQVEHWPEVPRRSDNLWREAADFLSEEERASLDFQRPEKLQILTDLHRVTEKERKSGEKVIVRDLFAKVAKWITRFKELGDVAVQFDPVHAALPRAGVKFLLKVMFAARPAISDFEVTETILEHTTSLAELISCYAVLEELYLQLVSVAASELSTALTGLYNIDRSFKNVFQVTPDFQAIIDEVATVQLAVDECARLVDRNDWLSTEPYKKHHNKTRKDFLAGTGTWLLTHPLYKECKDSSASSLLWLHGIPGSGKSKLVSLDIKDFLLECKNGRSPPPAYFYCSRNPAEPGRSNPDNILASIARQLARANGVGQLLAPVTTRCREEEKEGFPAGQLELHDCRRLILEILPFYSAVIVIDALDECDLERRYELLEVLDDVLNESSTLIRMLVSSRDDQDLDWDRQAYTSPAIAGIFQS
ncbi:uncharacterized protein DSM5745_08504 [Aspergillus mulundensis]|uniref:Nephrocystin 3-like N-terminal domain-containing protein n=1 Tax=Aspergillus mulundensis TaxID=1810919 RepID=A0A3D8R4J9_9EURO|nr:hypothetical protein DSM5745_08504 [Aspergillus mulundensis]RDW68744.1 hypothetical protein DSM5745_08504 [Aspergillus mulundensis]